MKTRIIFFFLIIVASCIQAQVRMVAGQPVLFEKQDVIDLATYNWPRKIGRASCRERVFVPV